MPPISTSFLGKTGLARLAAPALAPPSRSVTCMAKKKGEERKRGAISEGVALLLRAPSRTGVASVHLLDACLLAGTRIMCGEMGGRQTWACRKGRALEANAGAGG